MGYKITKDEDELWFDYDYYGTSYDIEYTITYKYEVIDSLLHFSNTRVKNLFSPSDKLFKDIVDTGEIIELVDVCSTSFKYLSLTDEKIFGFFVLIHFTVIRQT